MRIRRKSSADNASGPDEQTRDNLAAVNQRLDVLTQHIERIARRDLTASAPAANGLAGRDPAGRDQPTPDQRPHRQFSQALQRLDQQLEQIISQGRPEPRDERGSPIQPTPLPPYPAPASPSPSDRGAPNWAADISARRRALNAAAPQPQPQAEQVAPAKPGTEPVAAPAPRPGQDLTGLEAQLRTITHQIASLHQPYENAFAGLRKDLADVSRALSEAAPRRAIETLEAEVRRLTDRIDRIRGTGVDAASLASLERGLAEVRDTLHELAPAENLVGCEEAVRLLSRQIEELGSVRQDPSSLRDLELAIAQMRDLVSTVASDGALAQLSAEVHSLSSRVDRLAGESSNQALYQIEHRIEALIDASRLAPPALEAAIKGLTDRLDRLTTSQNDPAPFEKLHAEIRAVSDRIDHIKPSQSDQLAIESLQTAIHTLTDRLDRVSLSADDHRALDSLQAAIGALGARLDQVQASQNDHLALEELHTAVQSLSDRFDRGQSSQNDQFALEELQTAVRSLSDRFDHMQLSQSDQLAIGGLEDRIVNLAAKLDHSDARFRNLDHIERGISDLLVLLDEMRSAPRAAKPSFEFGAQSESHDAAVAPTPAAAEPPEQSDRIAPSLHRVEARRPINPDLPPDMPLEPGTGIPRVKPGSPAARIAASEADLAGAMPSAANLGKSDVVAAARHAAKSAAAADNEAQPQRNWLKRLSSLTRKSATPPKAEPSDKSAPPVVKDVPGFERRDTSKTPRQKILGHAKTVLIAASVVVIVLGGLQAALDFFMPANSPQAPAATKPDLSSAPAPTAPTASTASTAPSSKPAAASPPATPAPDVPGPTGAISPWLLDPGSLQRPFPPDVTGSIPQRQTAISQATITIEQAIAALPASIEPALRAAAGDNPAAAYEIAIRYAEGRGFQRNPALALFWLDHAAKAGFAPAQFRLGSLNEKGDGIKKDLVNAQRLYLAAANQGHAKAMHNLAVLYAEGIDGKPDYKAAAEWFRKAANYGVSDSQYNLAILYARGLGVDQNLAESYRWFALAAARGDQDAAKKRDEVAKRLDQQSLVAAKLAVQTFTVEPEPEAAVNLQVPPGGWATAAAQPPKSKPHTPAPAAR